MLRYQIGASGQDLILSDEVLDHFDRYRQTSWFHREAGGQLFAELKEKIIHVKKATGPRETDHRTRTAYIPDRKEEQNEIEQMHRKGLHYIGDWHTHPQRVPAPSEQDLTSIGDCFLKSAHQLNAFVMIIVGKAKLPAGLSLIMHDGTLAYMLKPAI